jgi:hypothetical protein
VSNTCMFVISEMLILITQDQAQIEVRDRRLPHMQFVGPRVPTHSQAIRAWSLGIFRCFGLYIDI